MDIPDFFDFWNYSKTLYESNKNGKPFCRVGITIETGCLTLWRFDFEEWERNRRTGIVEIYYSFDLLNTQKLGSKLKRYNSTSLIREIKKRFGNRVRYFEFLQNFKNFCDENEIEYNYNVWY